MSHQDTRGSKIWLVLRKTRMNFKPRTVSLVFPVFMSLNIFMYTLAYTLVNGGCFAAWKVLIVIRDTL